MTAELSSAKVSAKRVRARLQSLGVVISHTQSLETVSSVLSGTDWNRFCASLSDKSSELSIVKPSNFLLSAPGDGGWSILRFQHLSKLHDDPDVISVWIFPDRLGESFMNAMDLHIILTPAELIDLKKEGPVALLEKCRGKIVILHAPVSCMSDVQSLDIARAAFSSAASSGLLGLCKGVTFVDMHRWTGCAPSAIEFLKEVYRLNLDGVQFQSQIESDIINVSKCFQVDAYSSSLYQEKKAVAMLQDHEGDIVEAINVVLQGFGSKFNPESMRHIKGCVAYCRRLFSHNFSPKGTTSENSRIALIHQFLEEERRLFKMRN